MESISSKNIMHGDDALALENNDLILRSLSPNYIFINSGPDTYIKLAPHSFAVALAIIVFPQPGGPYSNIPEGVNKFNFSYNSYCNLYLCFCNGYIICCYKILIIDFIPPISLNDIEGIHVNPSLFEEGWILFILLSISIEFIAISVKLLFAYLCMAILID